MIRIELLSLLLAVPCAACSGDAAVADATHDAAGATGTGAAEDAGATMGFGQDASPPGEDAAFLGPPGDAMPTLGSPTDAALLNDSASTENTCFTPGPLQPVVTLADLGGQWVAGCDPDAPAIPLTVSGAAGTSQGVPADTIGFEIDPSSHLVYPLVPADGGVARATGPGSVWWATDPYPYGTMSDGTPEEYLPITDAEKTDGGGYTELLAGYGVLFHPATQGIPASLTLAGGENSYYMTLVPPSAVTHN